MASKSERPTAHTDLLMELSKELTNEDFRHLKEAVKSNEFGNFKPGQLEKIKTPEDLFQQLERKNIIKVGDYALLKELMEKIDKQDSLDGIGLTEAKLRKQGYPNKLDYSESPAGAVSVKMEQNPPSSYNNNPRMLSRSTLDDVFPIDTPQSMDTTVRDDRPRYEGGRGYVLFINNFVEHAHEMRLLRDGSELDGQNIEELFEEKLNHYKYVAKEDLGKAKLTKVLQDTKKKLAEGNFVRFILIICSHGEQIVVKNDNKKTTEERIIMVDGESVTEDELTAPFMGDQLKEFNGKPKVFIIQACRSPGAPDSADDLTEDQRKRLRVESEPGPPSLTRPDNADVLISYATTKGKTAWRNETDGSWYIHHFCQTVGERYKKEHLMDLLVRVNDQVAQMESSGDKSKQMPCQISTLTKHIWL